eukprot:TRINITY_DN29177_c0_g1_i1.p1 TRINITY_DN29177_c0_g1~~TRINITY_DN29177_c0_g1_i1.p1  ORF type:complete len:116 (-),score=5.92 TRINITY_DN29177_c0_g1_i1:233-580(-)
MGSPWVFVVLFFATTYAYPCNYSWNGVNYDASPMANPIEDYHLMWQAHFYINVCRPTVTQACGPSSAVCLRSSGSEDVPPSDASLGNASTAEFAPADAVGENGQGFKVYCWRCSC